MLIHADVKCYYCGHVSGQVEGDSRQPLRVSYFRPSSNWQGRQPRPGETLRCFRCGGPVYLDDVSKVRERRRSESQAAIRSRGADRHAARA